MFQEGLKLEVSAWKHVESIQVRTTGSMLFIIGEGKGHSSLQYVHMHADHRFLKYTQIRIVILSKNTH